MADKHKSDKQPKLEGDRLTDKEATKRLEQAMRNMVNTPPKPHKPSRKKDGDKKATGSR